VAVAGASAFVQGVHLPNLGVLRADFEIRAVMSRTGANARAVATSAGAAYCTTDFAEILADPDIDLVLIGTRHDLHAGMALEALRAGKHAFVEKPLALTHAQLDDIEAFYAGNPEGPVLMTGFNRRFAPGISHIRALLAGRTTPIIANYRMNAGYLPLDLWLHGPEGGGRNLGEACHIYDLFCALCGSADATRIEAMSAAPSSPQWARTDNFVATIGFADGSVCTLTYTAMGDKAFPKEQMDVFVDGKVIHLNDYKRVEVHGGRRKGWQSATVQKGHLQEMQALADTLLRGKAWPIALEEQLSASRIALEVERQIAAKA